MNQRLSRKLILALFIIQVLGTFAQSLPRSTEGEHKCRIYPCPHFATPSNKDISGYSVNSRGELIDEYGRVMRVGCPYCDYGSTGTHSCGRLLTPSGQANQAATEATKHQDRIRQSQATSDAFKNARDQLWEQQQKANQQIDWDKGARERNDRLNDTSKKVDTSLDQLSRAQKVLTWKRKIKEKEDLIAKTKATIARLEEAKKTMQSSQHDVENANREGTYYTWAGQLVGAVEMLDGVGVMVAAVLPPQYAALRKALKDGRKLGKGGAAVITTPQNMVNHLEKGDISGALVDAAKGVTAAAGAATTSKYASQQEKDFAKNLGRGSDVAEIIDESAKVNTDTVEYKKFKRGLKEVPVVGERAGEFLDGAEQVRSGFIKTEDMSDEEVKILTRAVAQNANFAEIMSRVDARLTLEKNTLIALEYELYRLKEDGPNNPAISVY